MSADRKPEKPTSDFPLFAHASGSWAKKIRGKLHYFGPWDDAETLNTYETWGPDLRSGRIERISRDNDSGRNGDCQARPQRSKPSPPWPGFPLFAHANGQWPKVIHGTTYYFGVWGGPHAVLERFQRDRDDPYAGRTPSPLPEGRLTIGEVVSLFLTAKRQMLQSGEMRPQTFEGYKLATTRWGNTLKNRIIRIRSVFKFAYDQELIERPIRYGQSFSVPRAATLGKIKAGRLSTPPSTPVSGKLPGS